MTLTTNNLPDTSNYHKHDRHLSDIKRHVFRISTDSNEVNQARIWLSNLLEELHVNDQIKYQLETVICEVINNIIIHSYSNNKNNQIDIYFRVVGKNLFIVIDDYGMSLNQSDYSDMNLLAESGRGLFIIQSWSDKFRYWSFSSLNRHCIVKRI